MHIDEKRNSWLYNFVIYIGAFDLVLYAYNFLVFILIIVKIYL